MASGTIRSIEGQRRRVAGGLQGQRLVGVLPLEDLEDLAVEGYAKVAGERVSDDERALLLPGLRTICLELSARFLDDALRESYFGYNAERYPAPGEHHLARGRAMAELAASVDEQRSALEAALDKAFDG